MGEADQKDSSSDCDESHCQIL